MKIVNKHSIFIIALIAALLLCSCAKSMDEPMIKSEPAKEVVAEDGAAAAPSAEQAESMPEQTENPEKAYADTPYKEIFEKRDVNFAYSGEELNFKAKTVDGEEFDSGSFYKSNRLTVLTVWSTYCTACVETMPVWAKLAKEYESSGVRFLGICEDVASGDESGTALAKEIIAGTGADYTQLLRSADIEQNVLSKVMYLPTTYFIDGDGKTVCAEFIGYAYETDWIDTIETIMDEKY